MSLPFTHLHVHSEYSLLDGFGRIPDMIAHIKELGMDSLALTDHGVLFGAVDFYKECQKQGIHPVIGCEVYVAPRSMHQKDRQMDGNPFHLVLLAENNQGYRNLCKLVSSGFTDGFYYKPRIDHDLLKKYHEGIICLSACIAGEIPRAIINDQPETAEKLCLEYRNIFGPENFFLEIQDHRIPQEAKAVKGLRTLSEKYGIPMVATNDAHYVRQSDAEAHDILLCIQTLANVDDPDRMRFPNDSFYLKSSDEMLAEFPDLPEAIENTHKIALRCRVSFDLESAHLPEYGLPEGFSTAGEYVRFLCEKGLRTRYSTITPELQERMDYELDVIHSMGFDNYFLVVWDFIRYAKENGIMVGPGRGSAAGSLVAYALDITTLDPIRYQLLFERFLNPERVTMPDIDCDFCYERRQEVIDYVIRKYGSDRVAQIITFGTMAARAAVRDVGRAMGMPYGAVDRVAKEIPNRPGQHISIADAVKENKTLQEMVEGDPQTAKLIEMSGRLEGLSRHASTHAAGVVIADAPLTEYVPLYRNGDAITTQFPMGLLEDLGLIKMDFLGLRTLTVIQDTVHHIQKNHDVRVDLNELDYSDPKVYALLSRGDTLGVFQLESSGMIAFVKELQPRCFEDIIAGISLYRPGPMDQIPRYIHNKKHPGHIRYIHPLLEPILNVTYGCMVYQEQVMQIFRDLAGFSMGRSDLVRRAMSKKKTDVMDHEGEVFIHGEKDAKGNTIVPGAVRRGVPEGVAKQIYAEMKDFAKYAFNKSHAAAYAVVAYQTAWLKTYYPAEFMAALISSVMIEEKKVAGYIEACKKMGIRVKAPDVNLSEGKFICRDGEIVFGLSAIKGLGVKPANAIVHARKKGGHFKSFTDFCERVDLSAVNKRTVGAMIRAGAFDFTGFCRASMLLGYEQIMLAVAQTQKERVSGQISLLDLNASNFQLKDDFPPIQEAPREMILADEKEVMGLYLSGHPLEKYAETLKRQTSLNAAMLNSYEDLCNSGIMDGGKVVLGGFVDACRQQATRNGQLMAFITVEDLYGKMDVVVFPKIFEKVRLLLHSGEPVLIRGRISYNEEMNVSVICEEMMPLKVSEYHMQVRENQKAYFPVRKRETANSVSANQRLIIHFEDLTQKPFLGQIKLVLEKYPGDIPVILNFKAEGKRFGTNQHLWINLNDDLMDELKKIIGEKNIEVKKL